MTDRQVTIGLVLVVVTWLLEVAWLSIAGHYGWPKGDL